MSSAGGSKIFQYVAAITGNLSVMSLAAMMGWNSPTLLKLEMNNPIAEDNPLGHAITPDAGSWIGSLISPGFVIGSFFFGYLAKRWGRKTSLLLCVIPFTISWIMIGTASRTEVLCIARFIGGIACGAPFAVLPMYNAEIADISIRGALGTFMQIFMNIGWLFSFSIGSYSSYTFLWVSCSILPIIFFISFSFMPETPYYLARKGRSEEVIRVLVKLRGKKADDVKIEAEEIQATVDKTSKDNETFKDFFRHRSNCRALFLSCMLFTFQCLTGILSILSYVGTIFNEAGTSNYVSPAVSTIIIGVVQLVASGLTPLLVERVGRKVLLIFSGIGETISLVVLGLYFYLKQQAIEGNGDVSSISWLPVASSVIFIIVYSLGWGPLPWAIMAEMFTPEAKSKAFGIAILDLGISSFIVVKFFPNIVDALDMYFAFWLFALFCLSSVAFTIFFVPETKGKSLQKIQAELVGDSDEHQFSTPGTLRVLVTADNITSNDRSEFESHDNFLL